jgi:hypothetical protein
VSGGALCRGKAGTLRLAIPLVPVRRSIFFRGTPIVAFSVAPPVHSGDGIEPIGDKQPHALASLIRCCISDKEKTIAPGTGARTGQNEEAPSICSGPLWVHEKFRLSAPVEEVAGAEATRC